MARQITVGLGGTFDHFHRGHQAFLDCAARAGTKLVVGVTQPHLITHKPLAELIEPLSTRKHAVMQYCKKMGYQCQVIELKDPYGPTIEEKGIPIDKLCVTEETISGGEMINSLRTKLGLRALPITICPLQPDELGQPIHSERIRRGTINRVGRVYASLFEKTLVLTPAQRSFFAERQGELVDHPIKAYRHWVVGDNSLAVFLEKNWTFDLGVYDLQTQRQPHPSETLKQLQPNMVIKNPPGTISLELISGITQSLSSSLQLIKVEGEEDLAVVALVLLAPLYGCVYYGQPDQGMVAIKITEHIKDKFYQALTA